MSPPVTKASLFKADVSTIQLSIEDNPSSAKGFIKHVVGITPSAAGTTLVDSGSLLKPHAEQYYADTASIFPVGLTSRNGGCIVLTQSSGGSGYSLQFLAAPAVVYPDDNDKAKKAHAMVGLSGVNSLTRGGEKLTFSELQEITYFSQVEYENSINRFRLVHVAAARHLTVELQKKYKDLFKSISRDLPGVARSDPDDFLVTDTNASRGSGTFFSAALPAYFPVLAGSDFAFLSEVPLPTSIVHGTRHEQQTAWESFKTDLIERGCHADSSLLDDPFFQLWMRAVTTSPSTFEGKMCTCPFLSLQTRDAQRAASQSMLKVLIDNVWVHDLEGKEDEGNTLFGVVHMIQRPFMDEDWLADYQMPDGTVYKVDAESDI